MLSNGNNDIYCLQVFGSGGVLIGGGARIRTLEGVSQQIYSLPSLTA